MFYKNCRLNFETKVITQFDRTGLRVPEALLAQGGHWRASR